MHATGFIRPMHGPAACMNHQFTVTSQAWGGDPQQPELRSLPQTKYDAFMTSAYYIEFLIFWEETDHIIPGQSCGELSAFQCPPQVITTSTPQLICYRNWYQYWGHCCLINDLGSSPQPEGKIWEESCKSGGNPPIPRSRYNPGWFVPI